jgi:hypothetical protein
MNSTQQEGSKEPTNALSYDALSYMQKQKFDYLKSLVENDKLTLELVLLIEGRGRNTFDAVVEKIELLNHAKQIDQRYHDALYDNFVLDTAYSSADIITIVSQVRREVSLKPYTSRWKQNCEADFFTLFIVQEVHSDVEIEGKTKKQFVGYKGVFKLKNED